uniref:U2A'/phosphoprotein 32 family A C-terminal domain-containing protein n=1 Tax=Spongospora subterranea TaxID=70186 RepID=A0A0H5R8E3_9EUKA|eukprot:CRZ10403.1 hypothetical protein [Spongospora subterranea]
MTVCYISVAVLQHAIGGQGKTLPTATHVDLHYRANSDRRGQIKRIEKLELVPRCRELNLSFNAIARLENLSALRFLRVLNVSDNRVKLIEGLESLSNLEVLDLSGNQIQTIPSTMKQNRRLMDFRLSRNKISVLDDVHALASTGNLTRLCIDGNPMMKLPHARQFVIFAIPSLDVLDGDSVLIADRKTATERFEREVLNQLQQKLEAVSILHSGTLKQLSDAEAQLREDERIMLSLRTRLQELVRNDEQQSAQLEDLSAVIKKNTETISKYQVRLADLEQQAETFTMLESRENEQESPELIKERDARAAAESRVAEMEKTLNHQLKIARGLLEAKMQRFRSIEQLGLFKTVNDFEPWQTTTTQLLPIAEELTQRWFTSVELERAVHLSEQKIAELEKELGAVHCKLALFANAGDNLSSHENAPSRDIKSAKTQMEIRLRRVILANGRLRTALAAARKANPDVERGNSHFEEDAEVESRTTHLPHERPSLQRAMIRDLDEERLRLTTDINSLKKRKALLEESVLSLVRHRLAPAKEASTVRPSQVSSTQTINNETTLATIFSDRERNLLQRNSLLEEEIRIRDAELEQIRKSKHSSSHLSKLVQSVSQEMAKLQTQRRSAIDHEALKFQLEERDAQIRYLIERLRRHQSEFSQTTSPAESVVCSPRQTPLELISPQLDEAMISLRHRQHDRSKIYVQSDIETNMPCSRNVSPRDRSPLSVSSDVGDLFYSNPVRKSPFVDKAQFVQVLERLKAESRLE